MVINFSVLKSIIMLGALHVDDDDDNDIRAKAEPSMRPLR